MQVACQPLLQICPAAETFLSFQTAFQLLRSNGWISAGYQQW